MSQLSNCQLNLIGKIIVLIYNELKKYFMRKNIHFRRIPNYIEQELQRAQSQHITVTAIIQTSKAEISNGKYRKFGISINKNGELEMPETFLPDSSYGLYAKRNLEGKIHKLKKLPKITKTFWMDTPNFGDPDKGYHDTYINRKVYQVRLEPPRYWEIVFSKLSENGNDIKIKAQINTTLNKENNSFNEDLLFAINLLQEQFRDCHVFNTNITNEEIRNNTVVGWEIFPPGDRDKSITIIKGRIRNLTPERQKEILYRVRVMNELQPIGQIVGQGMDSRYFGAKFGEKLVAFENIDYGNAIYILFDNWQEISQMSRIDIMKRNEHDFIRIVHKEGWEKLLKHYINELRNNN